MKKPILSKITIFLIRSYKQIISPLFPRACRYEPSCSEYSIEAIEKKGLIKGALLSIKRVLCCNPFTKGGYDPLPTNKKKHL